MARTNNLTNFLTDVASAIKTKTGDNTAIPASQFDTKIANISTGHLDNTEYAEANDDLDDILEGSTPVTIYPPDWSEIGYEDTPQDILDDFNYAKDIKDNWDSSVTDISYRFNADTTLRYIPIIDTGNATNMRNTFNGCTKIVFFPQLNTSSATNMRNMLANCNSLINVSTFDTSSVTNMRSMFQNCTELVSVPLLNTANVTDISFIFSNCLKLSNESLNNILQMCINATSYTGTKTLQQLGLTSAQATTCQSLSNWNAFVSAGWSTGY